MLLIHRKRTRELNVKGGNVFVSHFYFMFNFTTQELIQIPEMPRSRIFLKLLHYCRDKAVSKAATKATMYSEYICTSERLLFRTSHVPIKC